ncbi:DNA-binding protein SATB1 isoform X2 [Exaiptasia diaphana]|uniref:Homeobox domain-containing protein n=1 Tax=Exaiptasia diaphana TaxID=2652724 RepID=A0A913XT99_EXADI|nr:DNA-binding protein SATB1 isoform X2 [Exaiptasia diaphana]
MGENPGGVRFRSFVHHPIINEDGTETPNLVQGSGIDLPSNILLSSIAADVLSDMFQKGEIEGKIILKADNAKVFIQLRDNWKPHPLSDYTNDSNQDVTLQDAFGEILHVKDSQMSIHVHLCHEDWSEDRVRNTIKKLLEHYSQTHLERMQCPFSQGMLSQISRDQYPCRLSTDKIKHFGAWYERSNLADEDDPDSLSPKKPEISTQRGKKIVFSPAHEIPMLRSWYENDPKPNMAELSRFTEILNNSEFRKTREAVSLRHVNTWFKNERARWRRDSLIQDLSRPSMAVETMVVTTS